LAAHLCSIGQNDRSGSWVQHPFQRGHQFAPTFRRPPQATRATRGVSIEHDGPAATENSQMVRLIL